MTVEELKDKFHRVRDNRREVIALKDKAAALRQSAMGGAIRYDKDRIMTTPMNYQEQALIDAADLEAQAEKLITEGDVLRMELIKLIYKLDDISDQTVLIRYYFNNETLRSMAEETNHDPTTYWYRKENAIQKITEIA